MSYFTGTETSEERNRREEESGRFWDRIAWEREHCPPADEAETKRKEENKNERKESNE